MQVRDTDPGLPARVASGSPAESSLSQQNLTMYPWLALKLPLDQAGPRLTEIPLPLPPEC